MRPSPLRSSRYNLPLVRGLDHGMHKQQEQKQPPRPQRPRRNRSSALFALSAVAFTVVVLVLSPTFGVRAAEPPGVLRWAGDPEGGAPFVEANPARPDELVGFDVEIAALLARALGRRPEFVNINFTSID